MTFTPQVLTQTDNNNTISSSTDISFNGISTITTGYNTLILTVNSTTDSLAGGIQILFSDDNLTWITPYTDTYFSTNISINCLSSLLDILSLCINQFICTVSLDISTL